ncbi:MAG: GNAT family N-acetyltransferase [Ruminococcus sp.]|nr:GNAT family N-acetyltransferase [Ruminococcus sp.]
MELKIASQEQLKFIKKLYLSAFPPEERKPFALILRQRAKGLLQVFTAMDEGEPVGFAITAVSDSLILLDYLAVSDVFRNRGYGSEILKALAVYYHNTPMFLEIETPDAHAPNQAERLARKSFYLRNGYYETGISVLLWGVKMEILSTSKQLTYEECDSIYSRIYGIMHDKIVRRI